MNSYPLGEIVKASTPPEPVGNKRGRRVLVVEDDADLLQMIVRALSPRYAVYTAADGMAALELLAVVPTPELIVCDVMMPRLDGIAFARTIKAQTKLAPVPLIFLTAKDDTRSIIGGINAGARQYLTKPFQVTDLLARIGKLLPDKT